MRYMVVADHIDIGNKPALFKGLLSLSQKCQFLALIRLMRPSMYNNDRNMMMIFQNKHPIF